MSKDFVPFTKSYSLADFQGEPPDWMIEQRKVQREQIDALRADRAQGALRELQAFAAAEFAANYPQYTEEAKARLGTLWKAEDYLEPAMVAGKFSFECNIYPLPESRDFRVDLGTQETERIREQIKENVNQAAEEAVRAILERARECVGRMAERLGSYDPESPGKAPFRDTMITNMRDFAELLPRLNFTGSPDIEILAKDIAHLARFDPDRLRNNRAAQVQAKHEADKIMQRMEGYG